MALSDDEQRALDDIERTLSAEDPRFASRITEGDGFTARRRVIDALVVVACPAVLLAALAFSPVTVGVLILWVLRW
jgi:hypothetical protein